MQLKNTSNQSFKLVHFCMESPLSWIEKIIQKLEIFKTQGYKYFIHFVETTNCKNPSHTLNETNSWLGVHNQCADGSQCTTVCRNSMFRAIRCLIILASKMYVQPLAVQIKTSCYSVSLSCLSCSMLLVFVLRRWRETLRFSGAPKKSVNSEGSGLGLWKF